MERKELLNLIQKCGHFLHHRKGNKFGQYRILFILKKNPNMSQRDLQQFLNVKAGSLSEILLKMENTGLISRNKDKLDRRRIRLNLTKEGYNLIDSLVEEYESENENLFSILTDEECEILWNIMIRLYESWKGEVYA